MTPISPISRSAAALLLCAAATAFLAGCVAANPPVDLMARANAAISQADQSGASQHAPLELKFARQKFAEAQASMNREDHEAARLLAEEALVNAELAEAKAEAARARAAAKEVRRTVEALREELRRLEEEP